MKQTRNPIRRVLCMILAIVMVMSMLPATVLAAEGTTLYLKPNSNWTQANARFAMYCFGNGETWVDMSDPDGDGLYEAAVPAGYPNVIFCRMNPSTTANNWDNKWNQTVDLTVPTDGTNCYTVAEGAWEKGSGAWSTYTPAIPTGEVAEPVNDVTVHYRNTGLWSAIHAYGWLAGTETTINGDWPGGKLTENAEHKNWYTIELTDLNAPAGIGILFNNGSGSQTGDIMIDADGEYWYDSKLLTEAPETWADGTVAMVSHEATLHFADAKNWGSVYLHAWTNIGDITGGWPGTALAQGEDGFYSMTVRFEAPEGSGMKFLFNNGGDSGKTLDLILDGSAFVETDGVYTTEKWVVATNTDPDGKFYADIVDAPEAIAISPKQDGNTVTFQYKAPDAGSVSVAGTMNSWTPAAMTRNAYGVWTVTLEDVAYGLHQYKFIVDDTWLLDPLNTWIYTEENGNQNSAFLISDPSLDTNTVKINIHYAAPTNEWNVCAWGAKNLAPQYNFTDGVATITLDGRANQYVAFKVRRSIPGNDWYEQSGEIRVDLPNIVSGTIDVWVGSGFSVSQSLNADVVYANKVKSVELNYDNNTIVIQTAMAVSDVETAFALYQDGVPADIDEITVSGGSTILSFAEKLELADLYRYKIAFLEDINEAHRGGIHVVGTNTVYASDKFAEEFTYDGELGALWSSESTTFQVWAPTASAVSVNLYASGTEGTDDLIEAVVMTAGENGTWYATVEGDLNGTYYTYAVTVDGNTVEAVDPYARTTGVNGKRGMVIDLDSTDPEGWDKDCNPNPIEKYSDAIIYELHVRDFSIDDSSGVSEANRGKYLAFTEEGTTTANGSVTGIDYLKSLGFTHLHLLPVYDYGSVDETKCENFNWGYDPVNYNTPEGSYSTDPYNGEVRVKEFKEMVMALHEADISVIMDVVYNHVYDAGKFCMNQIVPKYFSRVNADGSYSNGSGCGNDTASEREMVRKYIVESVLYWHQEYHIDGFRFDLVGLLDATTINQIVDEVHECCPDVIFYGEGWTLGTAVEPGNGMATQANSAETPEFAYFSDTIRNLLAGSNGTSLGFVSGLTGQEETVAYNFMAKPWWTSNPQQIVQYASCHDNYTLIDKLILTTGKSGIDEEIIKMNNLAAAIYMTSQGISFIHAGEEFLREKLEEDGGRCENSYNASDYVNHIEWSNLDNATYAANSDYYKGLIEFRKAHDSLRLETREEIDQYVDYIWVTNEVVMFQIDAAAAGDISDSIIVIFNATKSAKKVTLPEGEWSICINNGSSGTDVLGTAESTVSVAGISAMVLVQGETEVHEHDWSYTVNEDGTHTATCACTETVTEPHTFEDGACVCGAVEVHEHDWSYTVNEDGTHTATCACNETVTEPHTFVDGVCACGAEEPEPEVETITVYFMNNWKWTEVKAYFWIGDQPQSASWPGDDMTLFGNDGTYDIYSIEIPTNITGLQINGIKDDGSGSRDQTPDITSGWYDGICYHMLWDNGNQVGSQDISVVLPVEELAIIRQPVSVEGNLGENAVFTVEATGEGLTYQWFYSQEEGKWYESAATGFDTATLTVQLLAYRDGQKYRCEITDANGETLTTDEVTMTIRKSIVEITSQPVGVTNAVLGQTYTYTVEATGESLTYLWEYSANGGETWQQTWLEGYNTATLTVAMNSNRDGNLYRCVVSSLTDQKTSEAAILSLPQFSAEIITQPVDVAAGTGETISFTVEAEGEDLSFTWYRSKNNGETWEQTWLNGYNTNTLSFVANESRCGMYKCLVKDVSGKGEYTEAVTLSMKKGEPELQITQHPAEQTSLLLNQTVTFTVEAVGEGLTYAWYRSDDNGETWVRTWMAGYNEKTLTFAATEGRQDLYRCVVTDLYGNTVTSQSAEFKLKESTLQITKQPEDVTIAKAGDTVTFTVEATGEGLTYCWYASTDGETWTQTWLTGYNTANLSFAGTAGRIAKQYKCVITDETGNTVETVAVKATVG